MKRFLKFLASEYRLERLANIAPKHIFAYVEYLKDSGLSPSYIKTELSAIRFFHDKIAKPRYVLPENSQLNLQRRKFGDVDRTWTMAQFNRFCSVCIENHLDDYVAIACLGHKLNKLNFNIIKPPKHCFHNILVVYILLC